MQDCTGTGAVACDGGVGVGACARAVRRGSRRVPR
jgi:hypothetical protein